ncbi:MAG: hypothetical protein N4A54_02465 [Peptostreptococcaceae bacterium]|nr:hypothetical protein [Peptostreptococcaceae bacterium]
MKTDFRNIKNTVRETIKKSSMGSMTKEQIDEKVEKIMLSSVRGYKEYIEKKRGEK